MNKKNTTKKTVKPAYTVDITNCDTLDDTRKAFIYTKVINGVPVNVDDVYFIAVNAYRTGYSAGESSSAALALLKAFLTPITFTCNCEPKKPWYKRAWNWMIGRK